MIKRSTALAVLSTLALALAVAGCGKDSQKGDPIPASLAARLDQRLQVIQSQLDQGGGACADITDKTKPVVESDLRQIPSSVDPDVRDALKTSFDNLFSLASSQCQDTSTNTTPTETNTTPTDTQTTPTETQQTETQQTQTQQTQTQELPPGQQKKQDKGKAKDKGKGHDGRGNGNGGGPAAPGN
jgi:hypothetical protein